MSDEYEIMLDVVEHEKQYDRKIIDVLQQPPLVMSPSNEFNTTSTRISNEIRAAVQILARLYSSDSWLKTSRIVIEHGFTILIHKNKDIIKEIENVQMNILNCKSKDKSKFNMFLVFEYQNRLIFGKEENIKMTIRIQPKYANAMYKVSSSLNFAKYDIIRACMSYSIVTDTDLPEYIIKDCQKVVDEFEEKLKQYNEALTTWNRTFGSTLNQPQTQQDTTN
jgi:hypothetical protein